MNVSGILDQLIEAVVPSYEQAEVKRLSRANRQWAIGGGHPFALDNRDQLLLTVIWLFL